MNMDLGQLVHDYFDLLNTTDRIAQDLNELSHHGQV